MNPDNKNMKEIVVKVSSITLMVIAICMVLLVCSIEGKEEEIVEDVKYGTNITIITNNTEQIDDEIVKQSVGLAEDNEEDVIDLYNKFNKVNEDTVAYLRIRNSNINFPVVQQHTVCETHNIVDNCYYLYRDIYKRTAVNDTAIQFMDANNYVSPTIAGFDQNTVIYGHTWTNSEKNGQAPRIGDAQDKQLGQLVSYTDMEWLNNHLVLEFTTGVERTYWVPQYIVYTDASRTYYPDGFNYFKRTLNQEDIEKLYDRSVVVNTDEVDLDTDKFMILSTCNHKYRNPEMTGINRFIVVFKYIDADSYSEALEIAVNMTYEQHDNVVDW